MSEQRIRTIDGKERGLDDAVIDKFASGLRGQLLRRGDPGYDAARKVWNGMVDKRPALIARCPGTSDVVDAGRFAGEHDLLLSVRGGGHNYAGKSVSDGGLMIDLGSMKGIQIDPARRTVQAQAGLRLGEFDRETQAFGLATTLGVNTDTGIAGLTLGGGYGWLDGKYGLACDNVLSAVVVTADGRVLTVNADENDDLYWGIRGAGANLGIVTSFEYRLHPYTQIQTLFDEAWPPGRRYYNKSSIIRRLSDPAINLLLTYGRALPTALSAIALQQLHGAASRVGAGDTAFPHRYDHYSIYVHPATRSEEHTSELQSPCNLVCRLLLEKKKKKILSFMCLYYI